MASQAEPLVVALDVEAAEPPRRQNGNVSPADAENVHVPLHLCPIMCGWVIGAVAAPLARIVGRELDFEDPDGVPLRVRVVDNEPVRIGQLPIPVPVGPRASVAQPRPLGEVMVGVPAGRCRLDVVACLHKVAGRLVVDAAALAVPQLPRGAPRRQPHDGGNVGAADTAPASLQPFGGPVRP